MRLSWTILVLVLVVQGKSNLALAHDDFYAALPTHGVFPTPSGILFPSLFTAAGVNPAALPQKDKKVFGLGINYSPPINETHEYTAALAYGDKTYGWGVGYTGSLKNTASHGVYLGGGFRTKSTAIGLSFRDLDLRSGRPSTDLGIIAGTDGDVLLGLVLYHIDNSPQLDVGLGFGNQKNYNFEVNLLMPTISNLFTAGNDYVITAATTVYASIFGLSFRTSYFTSSSKVTQSVSVMLQVSKTLSFTVQYESPNRPYYGMIFLF